MPHCLIRRVPYLLTSALPEARSSTPWPAPAGPTALRRLQDRRFGRGGSWWINIGHFTQLCGHWAFTAWERLAAVLTAKRLELLRHLHRNSAVSIAAPWFVSWDGITVRSMTMWRF